MRDLKPFLDESQDPQGYKGMPEPAGGRGSDLDYDLESESAEVGARAPANPQSAPGASKKKAKAGKAVKGEEKEKPPSR